MIPTTNLATLLYQTAKRLPEGKALVWRDKSWNWAELASRVRNAAAQLAAKGIGKGDAILVHSRNSNAMFESMWAAWTIGAVWVPTNFRLTPPEVAYLAQSSSSRVHIFDEAFAEHARGARAANTNMTIEISIGGAGPDDWEHFAATRGDVAVAEVMRDDNCWLFYTSGTTGRSKAAMLTHGQMMFVVNNHLCDLMPGTTEKDASLVVAPLSHGAGIHAMPQVARGAPTILLPSEKLDCEEAWRLVEEHRVSNMFTVPTILTMLTRHEAVDRHDHSSLRHVIYAGSPMYRADQIHALKKLGKVIVQYYGMGEVTGNITWLAPELHSIEDDPSLPIGSCGIPRTGMEIAILDDKGKELPTGSNGEICVRGPAVMAGYRNNPEANAKSYAHGWFHTGDLGHVDEKGFVYITGRTSDMYISGGSNIYPREIEEVLLTHPAVAEACVLGVPHEQWGETGVAILVAREGVSLSEDEIRGHLEGQLARYKWPSQIAIWSEIPKSGYGKVPKNEIRKLYLSGKGPAV